MGTEKADPQLIVKAGTGGAANALLENEAHWLRRLGSEARLAKQVPELVTHRSGERSASLRSARTWTPGLYAGRTADGVSARASAVFPTADGLPRLHLFENAQIPAMDLEGLLSEAWSRRIARTMEIIERSLEKSPVLLVAAHTIHSLEHSTNGNARCVFDWEYAAEEQLPLFDCLHFVLLPMALDAGRNAEWRKKWTRLWRCAGTCWGASRATRQRPRRWLIC